MIGKVSPAHERVSYGCFLQCCLLPPRSLLLMNLCILPRRQRELMLVWHQPGFGWYPGWVRGGRGVTLHLKPKCNYSLSGKPQGARLDQSADCFAACGRYQQQPGTGYFLLLKHPPRRGKGSPQGEAGWRNSGFQYEQTRRRQLVFLLFHCWLPSMPVW